MMTVLTGFLAVAIALPHGEMVNTAVFLDSACRKARTRVSASVTWRDDALCVRIRRALAPGENPKAAGTQEHPETMFARGGEEMELFLAPHPDNQDVYYQIAANPSNVLYQAKGSDTSWRPVRPIVTKPYFAPGEWGVDFVVPFGAFGEKDVSAGTMWRANFMGSGGMWSPTGYCHNPISFGKLVFGGTFPREDAREKAVRAKNGALFEPDRFYYPAGTAYKTLTDFYPGKRVSIRRLDGDPAGAVLRPGEHVLAVFDGVQTVESSFEVDAADLPTPEPDGVTPYYTVSGSVGIGSKLKIRNVFGTCSWEGDDYVYDSSKPLCGAPQTLAAQKELPCAWNRFAYEAQLGVRMRAGKDGVSKKVPSSVAFYADCYKALKPQFPHRTFSLQIDYPIDVVQFATACDVIEIAFPGCSYTADPLDSILNAFDYLRHHIGDKPIVFWVGGALPNRGANRTADEMNTAVRYTILRGGVGNMFHLGHGGIPKERTRLWDFLRGAERHVNVWYPAWLKGSPADVCLVTETGITAQARKTSSALMVLAVNLATAPRALSFWDASTRSRREVTLPAYGSTLQIIQ